MSINTAEIVWLNIKTSTQDYADSSDNLDIKICQDQKCCNTGTIKANFDKGSTQHIGSPGECDNFELNYNEDIDVTFTQLTTDGWRGELLSITLFDGDNGWKYECPITTWLDKDSTEGYSSIFETNCKVTDNMDYYYFAD